MKLKTILIVACFIFMSCQSHLQELKVFPQCQILQIDIPLEAAPDDVYYWTVWVNKATDSLEVKMFYQQRQGLDFLLLPPKLLKFERDVYPMMWITCPWGLDAVGKIRFEFRVWNRYTEVRQTRWVDIKKKHNRALKLKRLRGF